MCKSGFIFGAMVGSVFGMVVCATCPKINSFINKYKRRTMDAVLNKCEQCKQKIEEVANIDVNCAKKNQSCTDNPQNCY